jgi:hypothetical protein
VDKLFWPDTAYSFWDRYQKENGMKELFRVMETYFQGGLSIPPKGPFPQGFIQGGTFVFDADATVLAHFDASVGAHANVQTVVDLALERISFQPQQTGAL